MRDHGGNLDRAMALYGGAAGDWLDLSTGINRRPYPIAPLPPELFTALPGQGAMTALVQTARRAWRVAGALTVLAGAQAAIQSIPRLRPPGHAAVLAPTYNEHAGALRAAGWQVEEVADPADLAGADLAVVVNPNNPDGRHHDPAALLALADRVGHLVVDESFADARPELSLLARTGRPGLLVLRSFGKFYGLAGLRLGFAAGSSGDIAALAAMAGPWPVPGVALEIGARALADSDWAEATTRRLTAEAARLDDLAHRAGWQPCGGTELFRLYHTPDAAGVQHHLAQARIWSRIFPYSAHWLRLGLPGDEGEWTRLARALLDLPATPVHPSDCPPERPPERPSEGEGR